MFKKKSLDHETTDVVKHGHAFTHTHMPTVEDGNGKKVLDIAGGTEAEGV